MGLPGADPSTRDGEAEEAAMNEDQQIRASAMELAIRYAALYSDGQPVNTPAFPALVEAADRMEHYLRTGEVPKLPAGRIW